MSSPLWNNINSVPDIRMVSPRIHTKLAKMMKSAIKQNYRKDMNNSGEVKRVQKGEVTHVQKDEPTQ